MSLQTQIHSLVIRVADEFKTVYAKIGNLSSLSTTDKSTLVAAINELKAAIAAVAVIDDLAPGSTTTTFSASKIVTLLDDLRAQILGGADAAYDTLLELQQALRVHALERADPLVGRQRDVGGVLRHERERDADPQADEDAHQLHHVRVRHGVQPAEERVEHGDARRQHHRQV